jgi:hypothetical protein
MMSGYSLCLELFTIENLDFSSARIMAAQPLKGLYGNYTLIVQAQDLGIPPNSVTTQIAVCVTDFNDNTPHFISPQHNTTIRVPEVCNIMFWNPRNPLKLYAHSSVNLPACFCFTHHYTEIDISLLTNSFYQKVM